MQLCCKRSFSIVSRLYHTSSSPVSPAGFCVGAAGLNVNGSSRGGGGGSNLSKPVRIAVTTISSSASALTDAPKMSWASGCTTAASVRATRLTSCATKETGVCEVTAQGELKTQALARPRQQTRWPRPHLQRHVFWTRHGIDKATHAGRTHIEQRRAKGRLCRRLRPTRATRSADGDQAHSGTTHHRAYVGKVNVDQLGGRDQRGDT